LSQLLVPRSSHFNGTAAITTVAPMPLETVESFARAAVVANEKIGLFFLVSRRQGHAFLFEGLIYNGRMLSTFFD
jgi:hypothetical protein